MPQKNTIWSPIWRFFRDLGFW